ncbi:hypothetical protein WAI453_002073 [Rhynchosporium graminicola]|uniref:Related to glyoxal oxidase n=1 Tax=Rhynchosporium graminicola TaxID=2792576 RepID=A0A1E1KWF2_9HELO|nr:related to glyoxal oxidase precursor [Rhynchosporium commune]
MYFSKTGLLALCAASASAYSANQRTFAVNHFYGKGPLVVGRMDPIISPGVASGHVHAIQGGNAFALSMTDNQALKSTCTSSRVKNDKSNYWTPALYFQDPKTGKLEPVEMFYMNVYYFMDATTDHIEAFPEGLRIFTGNPGARSPPATGGKQIIDKSDGVIQPVQWTCPRSNNNSPLYPVNSNGRAGAGIQDPGNGGSGAGFPDKNCDGYASPLRADIHLPSCYNPAKGVQNYKENMEYPTNGKCQAGWKHVPHMFYEVYWNTPKFQDRWTPGQGKQPFVLSNGDPTGYSLHADFLNGWDPKTLQQIIDNCDAGSSGMDKCPGLVGGLNDPSTSCNIESPIKEVIDGIMDKLPGNNPIGKWGEAAPAPAPAPAPVPAPVPAPAPVPIATSNAAPPVAPKPTTTTKSDVPVTTSKTSPIITSFPAPPVGGKSNTMATSYVTEDKVEWTTVTANGPAPTSGSTVAAGWSYKGCFADTKDRVMTGIKFANLGNHEVTNTKCVAYCQTKGFSMAGTEHGGQCFCSNSLAVSTKVDEGKCSVPCEGDANQVCGGSMALSVYSKDGGKKRAHLRRHLHNHI